MSSLYLAAMTEERERLVEVAQSQARLIEAMAGHEATNPGGEAGRVFETARLESTLGQLRAAHE